MVFHLQFRGFGGLHHTIQAGQAAGIPLGQAAFLHGIIPLGKLPGFRHAAGVGGHAANLRAALVYVKHDSGNGLSVQVVGFGQPDRAFHGFVGDADFVGFIVFRAADRGRIPLVNVVSGGLAFPDRIFAVGQEITGGLAAAVCGERCDCLPGGFSGDGKLRAGKRRAGLRVCLDDLHAELDRLVGDFQFSGIIGRDIAL